MAGRDQDWWGLRWFQPAKRSGSGPCGATRVGFRAAAEVLYAVGSVSSGRSELPQEAVDFVARQMKVAAGYLGFYEWSGSTIEYQP